MNFGQLQIGSSVGIRSARLESNFTAAATATLL